MSRRLVVVIAVLAFVASARCRRAEPGPQTASALDDGRQWMDALPTERAPVIVRIAAAYARNQDVAHESELLSLIQREPASDAARQAYLLLSRSYLRRGLYAKAIANLDTWKKSFPTDPALTQERTDVDQLRGLPDQIRLSAPEPFALTHGGERDFNAPVVINKTPASYLLDTGAWISLMTEAEARRTGLTIQAAEGVIGESSGKGAKFRTGVAKEITIGPVHFHDVSFAILPDDGPWRAIPVSRRGILGVPILLAFECLRWTSDGTWTFACADDPRDTSANLTFFENHLLLTASFEGKRQVVALDTGAETTDLNSNFTREYAALVERGSKGTTFVSGAGGSSEIESVTLPEVRGDIAGTQVLLRQAHVTKQDNRALGGRCCVGNIGLDLLLQTGTLTIDFRNMTLRVK